MLHHVHAEQPRGEGVEWRCLSDVDDEQAFQERGETPFGKTLGSQSANLEPTALIQKCREDQAERKHGLEAPGGENQ